MNKSIALTAAVLFAASIGYGSIANADTNTFTAPAAAPADSTSAAPAAPSAPGVRPPSGWLINIIKQLDLTDAQKSQVGKILADATTKMDSINADTTLSADQLAAKSKQARNETFAAIVALLTPDQKDKFKQLASKGGLPAAGPGRYLAQLDLTYDQKSQIATIFSGAKSKTDTINADATLTADQKTTNVQQVRRDAIQSVMDVLTPDQKSKLKDLMSQAKPGDSPAPAKPAGSANQ